MRKELITALATVLTSTMVTIPIQAATPAEGRASGGFIGIPGELDANTQTTAPISSGVEDPGDIEENKALMDAFGGVDKYRASYEQVTPEYFKQKYGEAAEFLKDKIDTTTTDTTITSAITAVSNHFNTRWSDLGYNGVYAFDQRMCTDYLMTGRMFGGYEPSVLLHTILDEFGIQNEVWDGSGDSYTFYTSITTEAGTQYVAFGGQEVIVYGTPPVDLYPDRLADMYMGAYREFID